MLSVPKPRRSGQREIRNPRSTRLTSFRHPQGRVKDQTSQERALPQRPNDDHVTAVTAVTDNENAAQDPKQQFETVPASDLAIYVERYKMGTADRSSGSAARRDSRQRTSAFGEPAHGRFG